MWGCNAAILAICVAPRCVLSSQPPAAGEVNAAEHTRHAKNKCAIPPSLRTIFSARSTVAYMESNPKIMLLKSSTILCVPGGPGCMMPSFSLLDICGGGKQVEYGVESSALQKTARRRCDAHGLDRDGMRLQAWVWPGPTEEDVRRRRRRRRR